MLHQLYVASNYVNCSNIVVFKLVKMEKQQKLCAEVNKRAPSFLESGEWTDCKFVVGAEPHQVVVGGYKLVMAMASPVFEAMFYSSLAETKDHIPIVDVESETFKSMLRYIHTGNINLSSCDETVQLYYTAKKYMLDHLMYKCSNYLQNNVNLENVCQLYELSQLYEDEALTQKCINIFTENTKELLQDSSFKDASLSTVKKIFSQNKLNIDSEVDLINAAALYVSAQDDKFAKKKFSSPWIFTEPTKKGFNRGDIIGNKVGVFKFGLSQSEKKLESGSEVVAEDKYVEVPNVENNVKGSIEIQNPTDGPEQATSGFSDMMYDTVNKQQIRSIVNHIRLLTLTPQQYTDCAARFSLLTQFEDYAVILNMLSNKPSVRMPNGFSTSRVSRDNKIDKARSEAIFRHTVQNLSRLAVEELSPSAVFYLRNLPWRIEARPREKQGMKYLSAFVRCNIDSMSTNWSCDADVVLRLICHKAGAENFVKKARTSFNGKEASSRGYNCFLPWDTVLDPTQGYIQDDAITIEVHIAAEKPQGDI